MILLCCAFCCAANCCWIFYAYNYIWGVFEVFFSVQLLQTEECDAFLTNQLRFAVSFSFFPLSYLSMALLDQVKHSINQYIKQSGSLNWLFYSPSLRFHHQPTFFAVWKKIQINSIKWNVTTKTMRSVSILSWSRMRPLFPPGIFFPRALWLLNDHSLATIIS